MAISVFFPLFFYIVFNINYSVATDNDDGVTTGNFLTGNLSGLLLAGIAISAFTGSLTSLVMLTSEPDIKPVFSWLLGGLSNTSWKAFLGVLPFFSVGTLLIILLSRLLNVLSLSTNERDFDIFP